MGRSTEKVEDMKMVKVQKRSKIWKWSKYKKVELMITQQFWTIALKSSQTLKCRQILKILEQFLELYFEV